MEQELVTSIKTGIQQILTEIGFKQISQIRNNSERVEVITSIGITGDLKGTLMLKTNTQSAVTIANKMLLSIHPDGIRNEFGTAQKEAIYEVTNLFAGRSLNILSEKNIDCNLTPPTIITGNKISPIMCNITHSMDLYFAGDFGNLAIFVGITKK
ncbi:MAG: chemotaxis protein CheX [Spirochaetia bacterium]|jgi:chemotaxis protein CheX